MTGWQRRLCAGLLVLAISCSAEGGDPISVSQRGAGDLFAIIDNCPSVQAVTILAGGEILWSIERSSAAPENATIDIPLGRTPEGWNEVTPLIGGFEPGGLDTLQLPPMALSVSPQTRSLACVAPTASMACSVTHGAERSWAKRRGAPHSPGQRFMGR